MRPLLKWPGGKTRELSELRSRLPPQFDTFVEPFLGGGAALFALEPKAAIVNDAHPELIDLYRGARDQDPALVDAFQSMTTIWDEEIPRLTLQLEPLSEQYLRADCETLEELPPKFDLEIAPQFKVYAAKAQIEKSLKNKWKRLRRLEVKNETRFPKDLVFRQLETGLRAGYYTWIRDCFETKDRASEVATFYFLRELCYGSMFRQNKQGKFNIPYGGMGYNRKNLGAKVAELFNPKRRALLERTTICKLDFRKFFETHSQNFDEQTVVFLDPPYDSDFKEYAGRQFGSEEQRVLASIVGNLSCHVVGLVKATPLIRKIYQDAAEKWAKRGLTLHRKEYAKTYGYNVRGRNQRTVSHLAFWGGPKA